MADINEILNDPDKVVIIADKKVLKDLKLATPASESADNEPIVIND